MSISSLLNESNNAIVIAAPLRSSSLLDASSRIMSPPTVPIEVEIEDVEMKADHEEDIPSLSSTLQASSQQQQLVPTGGTRNKGSAKAWSECHGFELMEVELENRDRASIHRGEIIQITEHKNA